MNLCRKISFNKTFGISVFFILLFRIKSVLLYFWNFITLTHHHLIIPGGKTTPSYSSGFAMCVFVFYTRKTREITRQTTPMGAILIHFS